STTVNEKIKGWLYDTSGSKHDINARGVSRIAFSDDGTRVFSCGTNKGEPFMVEWHEGEGGVRHNYKGLGKSAFGAVHFDTLKNRYIAVGDEGLVKFWDMNSARLLILVDLEPDSSISSFVRFNRSGMLIVVATLDRIKILANPNGVKLLM
ncbi:topless-related protein 4-like protein isoform X1, partial [Tanacetum coccineum]